MSRSIFIQNSAGIASSAGGTQNPDDVAAGKVALLGADGEGVIGLGSAGPLPGRFQVVRGVSGGSARRTGILKAEDIVSVSFQGYEAPVAQVTTITPVAGSAAAGSAGVKITRIDGGFEKFPRANYEIEVDAGDSVQDVCDKLRAQIASAKSIASPVNGNNIHIVNTSGTTTLILTAISPALHNVGTAKQEWISFATSLFGDAVSGWTVASTTAPSRGHGSYGQVYEYENQSFGNSGFYYTETPYAQRPEAHADSATTYDLVSLQVRTNADPAINKSFQLREVVIAVKSGELDEDTVLALFGEEIDASASA